MSAAGTSAAPLATALSRASQQGFILQPPGQGPTPLIGPSVGGMGSSRGGSRLPSRAGSLRVEPNWPGHGAGTSAAPSPRGTVMGIGGDGSFAGMGAGNSPLNGSRASARILGPGDGSFAGVGAGNSPLNGSRASARILGPGAVSGLPPALGPAPAELPPPAMAAALPRLTDDDAGDGDTASSRASSSAVVRGLGLAVRDPRAAPLKMPPPVRQAGLFKVRGCGRHKPIEGGRPVMGCLRCGPA
jgi:hypothetical protein